MATPKVIYLAIPYPSESLLLSKLSSSLLEEIKDIHREIEDFGGTPVIHQSMFESYDSCSEEQIQTSAFTLLAKCDAAVFIPGWKDSPINQSEMKEAKRIGIPVFEIQRGWNDSILHVVASKEMRRLENFLSD